MFGVDVGVFQFDLLEGLYAAAEEHGHSLILTPLTRGRDELQAAQSLHDFRFDALIMLGPTTGMPLLAGRVPLVVVGWHVDHPAVDVVRTSDEHGMSLAVDHLVELGHRRIAHIDGGDSIIADTRREGYARRCGHADWVRTFGSSPAVSPSSTGSGRPDTCWPRAISRPPWSPTTTTPPWRRWDCWPRPASTCPARCRSSGWDDSEAAALSPIGLTSVAQDPARMARAGRRADPGQDRRAQSRAARDRPRAGAAGPREHRDSPQS